tara:strand:- start:45 stop:293 length:249 start_codon:yes stop_codon:yes gene_type:complete
MKIAGVSVNLKSLPSKEQLIEQALKSKAYHQKKDAKKLIESEIKASGLFKTSVKKVSKPKSDDSGSNRLPNSRKRKLDKAKD